ncbi:MAG: presenilin family intramembrane aspartyl protease [Candidatus Altiarchaeota archaeon]
MKHAKTLVLILSIYLATQVLGLYVGSTLIEKIEKNEFVSAVENPESPGTSAQIFLYVLVMTGFVLLLMKYHLGIIIRIILVISILVGTGLTFWSLTGNEMISAMLTLWVFSLYLLKGKNYQVTNFALFLTISGFGGWLGASLAFITALILVLILAVYDFIAVFGTKHMVTLAEESKGKYSFMVSAPFDEGELGLGTGDLAIPLVFTVSVLRDYSIYSALTTSLGGFLGLASLIYLITQKKKATLPALPPITIGLLLGFGIGYLMI